MKKYTNTVTDRLGNALNAATVTVVSYPSESAVTIYSDDGTTVIASSIITTNSLGEFSFYAPPGRYNLQVRVAGALVNTVTDVQIDEGISEEVASIAALKALKGMGTGQYSVSVLGYTSAGDGGGGSFYWDSASTATANDGTIIAPDAGGAGRWRALGMDVYNLKRFGSKGDASTDDTTTFSATITAAKADGKAVFIPKGRYKITATLPSIDGQFTMYGEGMQESEILFIPTANDVAIDVSNGASRVERVTLRDFAIKSTDTTYTKVALDIYDVSMCQFERLFIWGSGGSGVGANATWAGSNSIGIRTHGRELASFKDIEVIADRPIVIAANPNTAATDGEDSDHFSWENMYLVSGGTNYLIEVDAGIGLMETEFRGFQSWVGGGGGFKMNDTRVAPTVPSRGIRFSAIRGEQGTDVNGYWFDITATSPIQQLSFDGVLGAAGTQGIKVAGVLQMSLTNVTMATAAGKNCILVTGVTGGSTITLQNCNWQPSSVFTLTGYNLITADAFESSTTVGPSSAVYAGTRTGSSLNVARATVTGANGTTVLDVTGTTGDSLQVIPQAAGSGMSLRAMDNAQGDFEPMAMTAETYDFRTRTGAATSASALQLDATTTAGQTRLLLYDVDNATLERVTVGAADSGGAGFKVLRIPN